MFLRIKIGVFLRAVRLYFCMSVYLYDLCVLKLREHYFMNLLFCETFAKFGYMLWIIVAILLYRDYKTELF